MPCHWYLNETDLIYGHGMNISGRLAGSGSFHGLGSLHGLWPLASVDSSGLGAPDACPLPATASSHPAWLETARARMPRHALERALTYFLTCVLWVSGRLSTGPKEIHTGTNYENLKAMQEEIRSCGHQAQLSLQVDLDSQPLERCRSMLQEAQKRVREDAICHKLGRGWAVGQGRHCADRHATPGQAKQHGLRLGGRRSRESRKAIWRWRAGAWGGSRC